MLLVGSMYLNVMHASGREISKQLMYELNLIQSNSTMQCLGRNLGATHGVIIVAIHFIDKVAQNLVVVVRHRSSPESLRHICRGVQKYGSLFSDPAQ